MAAKLSTDIAEMILRRLEEAGMDDARAQKLLASSNPDPMRRLVRAAERADQQSSVPMDRARDIMGKDFLWIDTARDHFKVHLTEEQARGYDVVPFDEAKLEACRGGTHVLVATVPLSIIEIRRRVDARLFCTIRDAWYERFEFANMRCLAEWHLLQKTYAEGSMGRTWNFQKSLLTEGEKVPHACVVTYASMAYFLKTGERLFPDGYVRCPDKTFGNNQVYVGDFDADGFGISDGPPDVQDPAIGIAAEERPS